MFSRLHSEQKVFFFVSDQLSPRKRNFISPDEGNVCADSGLAETAASKSRVPV